MGTPLSELCLSPAHCLASMARGCFGPSQSLSISDVRSAWTTFHWETLMFPNRKTSVDSCNKWSGFCCISLCDILLPKLPHKLSMVFASPALLYLHQNLAAISWPITVKTAFRIQVLQVEQSWILHASISWCSWPLNHSLESPRIYQVTLCYFVVGSHPT